MGFLGYSRFTAIIDVYDPDQARRELQIINNNNNIYILLRYLKIVVTLNYSGLQAAMPPQ